MMASSAAVGIALHLRRDQCHDSAIAKLRSNGFDERATPWWTPRLAGSIGHNRHVQNV
jgi:hypothetical protein